MTRRQQRNETDAGVPEDRPLRLRRNAEPGETGAALAETDPAAALRALLAQIDRRWPERQRGREDGIQAEGSRLALAISQDAPPLGAGLGMPPLPVVAAALGQDPRVERVEILTPNWHSSRDIPYLKVLTRRGASSQDTSPWTLPGSGGYLGPAQAGGGACFMAATGRHPPPGTVYPAGHSRAGQPIVPGRLAQSYNNCSIEAVRILVNQLKGTHYTEDEFFDHAVGSGEAQGSTAPKDRYLSGSQTAPQRCRLLMDYGVSAELVPQDIETIARAVAGGQGLILSHDPGILWDDVNHLGGRHAVNTVGVTYSPDRALESVTVLDTGTGNCPVVVPIARYVKSLGTWFHGRAYGATALVPTGIRTVERVWPRP